MNEGIHLYSLASIYASFNSMINIYDCIKDEYKNNRIKQEKVEKTKQELEEYNIEIKKYIQNNLYDDKQKILLRNGADNKTDISMLGVVYPLNYFLLKRK